MRKPKRKRLEAKGWKIGTVKEFLGLSDEESAYIDLKIKLAGGLRERRQQKGLSQLDLAAKLQSSQSRVAKMEAGDPSVSLDLLIRSLISLGASERDYLGSSLLHELRSRHERRDSCVITKATGLPRRTAEPGWPVGYTPPRQRCFSRFRNCENVKTARVANSERRSRDHDGCCFERYAGVRRLASIRNGVEAIALEPADSLSLLIAEASDRELSQLLDAILDHL